MIAPVWIALAVLAPLTADDAVGIALEHNPNQAVLGANLDEERAEASKAFRIENPELRIGDFRSDLLLTPLIEGTPWEAPLEGTRFGIRWSPPGLEDFGPRQRQAAARVAKRKAELESGRRKLATYVRRLHARVRNLDSRIVLATTGKDLADRLRKVINDRTAAGLSTKLDTSLGELEYLDAAADLEELRTKARIARHEFIFALGLEPGSEVVLLVPKTSQCRRQEIDTSTLVEQATSGAPVMQAMRARIDEVDAEIFETWFAFVPWFDFVQVAYSAGGVDQPGEARFRLGITLPFLDFRRDDAAVLRARRTRHEAEARAARLQIGSDVRRAVHELESRASLVDLYAQSQRQVLDAGLKDLEQAIEDGDADVIEVTLLRSRVLRAKRSMLRSELECEEAAVKLSAQTGAVIDGARGEKRSSSEN